jgi:hypothetical protein
MIEIENPLLKDCENFPDSLFMFKKVKGHSIFNGLKAKDFMELSFKDVEFIKTSLSEPNETNMFKILEIVFGVKNFSKVRLLEFYKAYNYIVEQITQIIESEKSLSSPASDKLLMAGIERMTIFGALNILDDIARRYSKSPQEVENWSYGLIFSLSLKMKYENDIQKNLENAK